MKNKLYQFRRVMVDCLIPVDAPTARIAGYVMDALEHSGAPLGPSDPLFHGLSVKNVIMLKNNYANPNQKEVPHER